jgi:hypothetical protein
MDNKLQKVSFEISVECKVHCLAIMCANNVQHVCNLKGVGVDETGMCAGLVEFKPKKKKSTSKDGE